MDVGRVVDRFLYEAGIFVSGCVFLERLYEKDCPNNSHFLYGWGRDNV